MKKHTLLLACAMRILLNLIALPSRGRRSEGADGALAEGKCAGKCVSSRRFTAAAKRLFL